MKKYCVYLILFIAVNNVQSVFAQVNPHFNHITIYVVDMNNSAAFYENIMHLKRIPEPFNDNRHIWLRIGEHSQLHIVQGADSIIYHDINIHLAFSVSSLDELIQHLKAEHIKFGNWNQTSENPQMRPDGIAQIYLQDPDGYWLEVNNDKF